MFDPPCTHQMPGNEREINLIKWITRVRIAMAASTKRTGGSVVASLVQFVVQSYWICLKNDNIVPPSSMVNLHFPDWVSTKLPFWEKYHFQAHIYPYIYIHIYISYPYITLLVIYPVKYPHIPIKSHEEIIRSRIFASQSPAPWKCTWRIPPGTLWLVAYGSYGPLSMSLSCRCSLHTHLRHLPYKMHLRIDVDAGNSVSYLVFYLFLLAFPSFPSLAFDLQPSWNFALRALRSSLGGRATSHVALHNSASLYTIVNL